MSEKGNPNPVALDARRKKQELIASLELRRDKLKARIDKGNDKIVAVKKELREDVLPEYEEVCAHLDKIRQRPKTQEGPTVITGYE